MESLLDRIEVAPKWELPSDADPSDVTFDFRGGATITGDALETRELETGQIEVRPVIGLDAPRFQLPIQLVDLRWDGPGDRGREETRMIRAAATLPRGPADRSPGARPHTEARLDGGP